MTSNTEDGSVNIHST